MPSPPDTLVALVKQTAVDSGLQPELVCAVVEQESSWNPWAIRYEPRFMAKYVAPLYSANKITATEAYARSFSWGLLQCMGQVAREIGYLGPLPQLCDPNIGVSIGCKILKMKLDKNNWDLTKSLLAWNGGANPSYPTEVLARVANYK